MNRDPLVMEYFPALLDRQASDELIDAFRVEFAVRGFCPFAVEALDGAGFIGFVGLHGLPSSMSFAPGVEIGWRLAQPYWGSGLATEAAREVVRLGFDEHGLDEIVSFTSVRNRRSRAVMERLGMSRDARDDFDHPALVPGDPLRAHVLYRLRRADNVALASGESSDRVDSANSG